uniref:hypothetical protein n=1 Tax=Yoonia sp. TaxID=2212373 RepID=UPI0040479D61
MTPMLRNLSPAAQKVRLQRFGKNAPESIASDGLSTRQAKDCLRIVSSAHLAMKCPSEARQEASKSPQNKRKINKSAVFQRQKQSFWPKRPGVNRATILAGRGSLFPFWQSEENA